MLYYDSALAFLHFVFAFVLVGTLVAEAFILRLPVDSRVTRLLLRVDLFYGISAVLVILAGIARVVWGAKGAEFYMASPFFWAKMGAFLVVGLISALPTMTFIRWGKAAGTDASFVIPEADVRKVRNLVMAEIHILVLVPLFASLMARGIGM